MAPRPLWIGSVSFGLVNVPVRLLSASHHAELRFRLLHDADLAPIRERWVCSRDGREVPYAHLVRGLELKKGRYLPFSASELERLHPRLSRTLPIEAFVAPEEIDPLFYRTTYYLVPEARTAARAYALLVEALRRAGRVGLGRLTLRGRQAMCVLRPAGLALAVTTLAWAEEVVRPGELPGLPAPDLARDERELALAGRLLEAMASRFEPTRYRDGYRDLVLALAQQKAQGQAPARPAREPGPEPTPARQLASALQASLAQSAGEQAGELRHRPRAAARVGRRRRR